MGVVVTAIAVVGLHRGGTSAVAGVLHNLGVFMGDDLLPPSEHNPKGYFEDRRFVELHDKILGGDWKYPPADYMHNWGKYKDEYLSLVNEFNSQHDIWGVKDPRLCYTLPCLKVATKYDLKTIVVYRDPWDAAASLYKRGGHEYDEALDISLRYLTAMMLNTEPWGVTTHLIERPKPLYINFKNMIEYPKWTTTLMAAFIGTRWNQQAEDFIDKGLVHHG